MRSKHNKKRNTAFLYEVLIRELTNAVVAGDVARKKVVVETIKTCFKRGTALGKELELFKTLNESTDLDSDTAAKILAETKEQHRRIDKKRLFLEQSNLISRINKKIDKSVLQNFVPSYRNIATVYQIFNETGSPHRKVMLEQRILSSMTSTNEQVQKREPISNLAFKTFIGKFNDTYSGNLLEEQQKLLGSYITSFSDNGVEFKVFLNEELGRLKEALTKAHLLPEVREDKEMTIKTNEVLSLLESFAARPVDKEMVEQVLKVQELVKEME